MSTLQTALNKGREVHSYLMDQEPKPTFHVEVIGSWVWLSFDAIPNEGIRAYLKENKYHWNRKRKTWQLCCGLRTAKGGSKSELIFKYGIDILNPSEEVSL